MRTIAQGSEGEAGGSMPRQRHVVAVATLCIASLVLAAGICVLAMSLFATPFAAAPVFNLVAMNPFCGVGFVLIALGLFIALPRARPRWRSVAGMAVSVLLLAIGGGRLIDLHTTVPLPAQGLFGPQDGFASSSAVCFLFAALGLGTIYVRANIIRVREAFAVGMALLGWLSIISYAFDIPTIRNLGGGGSMSLAGAAIFLATSLALLLLRPREGFMAVLLSKHLGGYVARQTVPVAFLVPLLIGYVRIYGERTGSYSTGTGIALATALVTLILASQAAFLAIRIDKMDRQRQDALNALEVAEAELRSSNTVLSDLASLDPLTGLLNRRSFDEMLNREIERSRLLSSALSVVMIDLDRFKEFNDRHGHLWGDELLKGVSEILRDNVRAGDGVARIGGDEFALILPNTPRGAAEHLADRVRRLVAVNDWHHNQVTLCAGVASLNGGTAEMIMEAADGCLYEAKHMGRNRVVGTSERIIRTEADPAPEIESLVPAVEETGEVV